MEVSKIELKLREKLSFIYAYFAAFVEDKRGGISIKDIVVMAIGFVLVAILTPIGMTELVGANTTGWNASVITIFQTLLPVLYIIGVAIVYVQKARAD